MPGGRGTASKPGGIVWAERASEASAERERNRRQKSAAAARGRIASSCSGLPPKIRRIQAATRGLSRLGTACYAQLPTRSRAHARSPRPVEDPPIGEADRADRPGPRAGRARHAAHRRVARAGSRQAHAVALHRVRRRRAACKAGEAIAAVFKANNPQATEDQVAFERNRLARAPLVVAVVSRAAPHVKIPEWEQVLSAGAAAMNLVTAAHALGYAANWITEWYAYDRARARCARARRRTRRSRASCISARPVKPPEDRPRPPLAEIVTQVRQLGTRFMFYATDKTDHGLPHDPFKAIVAPRPIGWITTHERERRDQSRALFVFQRRAQPPADGDVRQRRPQGFARLRRGDARSSSAISRPGTCASR